MKSSPSGSSTVTLKSPGPTSSNPNSPFSSVTSVATVAPSGVCRVTVTPGTPSSPGSCTPSPSASLNTKSPTLPGSGGSSTNPASRSSMFSPSSTLNTSLMPFSGLISLSRLSSEPWFGAVKSNPSGSSTVTLKSPGPTSSNPNSPFSSVTSVATVVPSGVCRVTVTPGTPSSPGSCIPLPLASSNTEPSTLPGSGADSTIPASKLVMSSPSSRVTKSLMPLSGLMSLSRLSFPP